MLKIKSDKYSGGKGYTEGSTGLLALRLPNNANDQTCAYKSTMGYCMRPITVPWIGCPPFPIRTENGRFNMVPES
jgi:hypothetical protein